MTTFEIPTVVTGRLRPESVDDYVQKVTFLDDKITVHGSVPLTATSRAPTETEAGKLEFSISDQITPEEKLAARRRMRIQRGIKSAALPVPANLAPHSPPSGPV